MKSEHNQRSNGAGGGRLSADHALLLTGQIGELARAGMPLPDGLRALGEEVSRGRLRRTLDRMATALEAGASLDEAIAAQGGRVPGHLRGLVRAGARTGRIGESLARFAGYASLGAELRWRLLLAVAYSLIAFSMASGLLVLVCTLLVGSFKAIFADFGVPLPVLTRMVIAASDLIALGWRPVAEALIVLALLWAFVATVVSTPVRRSLASRVPLIGPVWRWASLAEFCHLLALLLEADVPLPEALPMAGEGVQDADLIATSRSMVREIEGGEPLSRAVESRRIFPQGLGRILGWAQGHRSLPEALHMAGEMYEARVRAQANFAGTVLSVLTVIIILGGIGLVVPALFLPLITLIQKLSG